MTIQERYDEWLRRACEIAKELHLEIEFTTEASGYGYSEYRSACVEVISTQAEETVSSGPLRYFCISESTRIE